MSPNTCPQCGKPADGNFCSSCGSALGARFCNSCGAEAEPGSKFCNQCGSPLAQAATPAANAPGRARRAAPRPQPAGGGAGGGNRMLWWVAGGALVGLVLIVAYPVVQDGRGSQPEATIAPGQAASGGMPAGAGQSSLDLSSMTPREAADRLFNRVMRAVEVGDTTEAVGFLPMAISAYDIAQPLDADGYFHLAMLKQTGGDFEGALESARAGLSAHPDHLLDLAAAARAAHAMGDDETARGYYQQLLDVWDDERASGLEDYAEHPGVVSELQSEAQAFLDR